MKLRTIKWMTAGALALAMASCSSYYDAHLAGAEAGKAEDQYAIGTCYYDGSAPGGTVNKAKAAEWFTKAAQQGNAKAQNKLGLMYDKGDGVPQDDDKAVYWLKQAAMQGNTEAQYNLGNFYYFRDDNDVVEPDSAEHRLSVQLREEAAKWYRMAAEKNHAWAQYYLSRIYLNAAYMNRGGFKVKCNLGGDVNNPRSYWEESMEWLRKAAAQGDPEHVKTYEANCKQNF